MNDDFCFVNPGKVRLQDIPTDATGCIGKEEAKKRVEELGRELNELEEWLFAAKTHSALVIFQGRDTSGKDGVIRNLLSHLNAISINVTSFVQPTARELSQDFLWRIHMHTPPRGALAFFNRSHYEDVLVVRAKKLVAETVWRPRYEMINNFEEILTRSNTILLKFFLHISKDEQKERLLAREREPEKAWKLNPEDWAQRKLWPQFSRAYEEVFEKCSPKSAPWHIIPADHKWHRDLSVFKTVVKTLRPYKAGWMKSMESMGREKRAELAKYRAVNELK